MVWTLDPYARPAGALSEVESRIATAAFAAQSLFAAGTGKQVRIQAGIPTLVASNDKSDVLIISIQGTPGGGGLYLCSGQAPLSPESAPTIFIDTSGDPFQQILYPGERLYLLGGAGTLIVSEATP